MSRRLLSSHCRAPSASDNPYQLTTIPVHHTCISKQPRHHNGYVVPTDTDTCTDSHAYYDCYGNVTDRSCSDESGSFRPSSRRHENGRRRAYASDRRPRVHRVFPQKYEVETAVYQEVPTPVLSENVPKRPQSAMSSGVTSAIVDGCGGKCQTFENVCYFILQLVFMMSILIGVSLCIAGLVLRKSAARNLQVLVYIGALLAVVSGLLLGIQWRARITAKRRKMAVRNAKRAPIPLETLNRQQQQQPLMIVQDGNRAVPQLLRPLPQHDQQGIPWWRRKDLV